MGYTVFIQHDGPCVSGCDNENCVDVTCCRWYPDPRLFDVSYNETVFSLYFKCHFSGFVGCRVCDIVERYVEVMKQLKTCDREELFRTVTTRIFRNKEEFDKGLDMFYEELDLRVCTLLGYNPNSRVYMDSGNRLWGDALMEDPYFADVDMSMRVKQ